MSLALCGVSALAQERHEAPPQIDESQSELALSTTIDEPLVTDRPDFTESTDAVGRGRLQLEVGYTYTYDGADGGVHTHNAPEALLRIGVRDGIELRIAWPNYVNLDSAAGDAEGLEDLSLGVKVKVLEQDGLIPHFGVIGEISIPTGADDLSSDEVDPGLKLLWAYDLNDRWSIAGNFNFASVTEDDDRFFQGGASLALGLSVTERIGAFLEYFGIYPAADGAGPAHFVNGGATYLVNNNFQLDVRVGFGLNSRADDFFTGAGFAWRF